MMRSGFLAVLTGYRRGLLLAGVAYALPGIALSQVLLEAELADEEVVDSCHVNLVFRQK